MESHKNSSSHHQPVIGVSKNRYQVTDGIFFNGETTNHGIWVCLPSFQRMFPEQNGDHDLCPNSKMTNVANSIIKSIMTKQKLLVMNNFGIPHFGFA